MEAKQMKASEILLRIRELIGELEGKRVPFDLIRRMPSLKPLKEFLDEHRERMEYAAKATRELESW